ncbi:MAG: ABC transporter permease [Rubripirellula sp.]|nr:ABC transporter permease [Rubripirellula sp.]
MIGNSPLCSVELPLVFWLLCVVLIRELPAEIEEAWRPVSQEIALGDQSRMLDSPCNDLPVRRQAEQQFAATTLIAQRAFESGSGQQSEDDTASIVIRTKRPAEVRVNPGIERYGLTRADFEVVRSVVPNLVLAVPFRTVMQSVRYGDREQDVKVVGTTMEISQINGVVISSGRFLTKRDVEYRNNVAVIAADIANRLFQGKDPIGKNLRFEDDYFLVVGVTEPKKLPGETGERSIAPGVYIPITTMNSRFGDRVLLRENGSFQMEFYELSGIHVVIKNREEVSGAVQKIGQTLAASHETADYTVDVLNQ